MDWLGAGIDVPLIVIRAIHLAATAVMTGTLVFRAVVTDAAIHSSNPVVMIVRAQTLRVAWACLAVSVVSGLAWLLLAAASISGLPFREAMTPSLLSTVVNDTQFGLVSEIRVVMAVILAGCLAYDRVPLVRGLALAMSLGLTAAIAWTGHAGSTAGEMGIFHLTADILHLFAAATWVGGLVSLVLLLSITRRDRTDAGMSFAREATQSFSTMGLTIVVVIFATGIVNAWILVGSLHGLIGTEYGRLLMLKTALFAGMLSVAGVNRYWLTPGLASPSEDRPPVEVLRLLTRGSLIEIALASVIFAIVGMLGTLHPATHAL
ncbi:MAG: copper homeostasis membrane protein CopD [Bradyrhizobium sp.]|uniref:copper homeostasis membrane protein CopD n=1 Tax=Bradyrhizobium sp. TaxID=376 RepID=UPI001213D652|nr:copper homeostasis membrane protein CopD [Bradyrhizobium sp.]THD72471.1 MAG: copper homeostasis membrane protein CopD [Bradyrhizobium sp.]